MLMSFRYFSGDNVINLKPHNDAVGNLVPSNTVGRVLSTTSDHSMVTVEWKHETLPYPVTTQVPTGDIYPRHDPPQL